MSYFNSSHNKDSQFVSDNWKVSSTAYKASTYHRVVEKTNLDINNMSNYRRISNLAFLGKVIERSAIQQLQMYLSDNNLYASTQSAYRPFHSVETAVLKVQNDILAALDHRNEALLVILDFSAAFDLIDHRQLLDWLSSRYGVKAKALEWFESYLDDRTQSVVIRDVSSDPVILDCGVPQGSVTGHWLLLLSVFRYRISSSHMTSILLSTPMIHNYSWRSRLKTASKPSRKSRLVSLIYDRGANQLN